MEALPSPLFYFDLFGKVLDLDEEIFGDASEVCHGPWTVLPPGKMKTSGSSPSTCKTFFLEIW